MLLSSWHWRHGEALCSGVSCARVSCASADVVACCMPLASCLMLPSLCIMQPACMYLMPAFFQFPTFATEYGSALLKSSSLKTLRTRRTAACRAFRGHCSDMRTHEMRMRTCAHPPRAQFGPQIRHKVWSAPRGSCRPRYCLYGSLTRGKAGAEGRRAGGAAVNDEATTSRPVTYDLQRPLPQ